MSTHEPSSATLLAAVLCACCCALASGADAQTLGASTSSSSCVTCGERVDADFVEAVKRHILNRLQMRERPNITHPLPKAAMVTALRRLHAGKVREDGRVEIPNFDGQGYHNNDVQGETSEIISFAESDGDPARPGLYFLVPSDGGAVLQVTQASLWLFLRLAGGPERGQRRRVTVVLLQQGAALVEERLELRRSGWHALPLPEGTRAALGAGQRLQLEVRCEGCQATGVEPGDPAHRPFLAVRAGRGSGRRRSRRGLECEGGAGEGLCCRRQLYIDFRLIGWSDWIIAPAGYYGNYCEGGCPTYMAGVPGSASSFHTAVVNQYRLRGLGAGAGGSCCVPTLLGTMSMLYYDDQYNIVKRDVPNMIVEECGCA